MRFIVLFLLSTLCSLVSAGEWTVIDSDTLSFSGTISKGEFERFNKVYNSNIKQLIVNSPGGATFDALEIGMRIYSDKLNVEVNGKCFSSCALYFFLPAQQKTLKNGLVGFHGSVGVTEELYPEDFYNPPDEILHKIGLSKEEALQKFETHIAIERKLFAEIGVSKELFLRSDSFKEPKHMGCKEKTRTLIASIETLEKYGVAKVIGPINPMLIETIKTKHSKNYCFI